MGKAIQTVPAQSARKASFFEFVIWSPLRVCSKRAYLKSMPADHLRRHLVAACDNGLKAISMEELTGRNLICSVRFIYSRQATIHFTLLAGASCQSDRSSV
jgi:hypothetical protein